MGNFGTVKWVVNVGTKVNGGTKDEGKYWRVELWDQWL